MRELGILGGRRWTSDHACQYRAVRSPVHGLGAALKLAIGTGLCAAAVVAHEPWSLAAVAALNAAYYFGARLTLSDLWRDTRYILVQVGIVIGLYLLREGFPRGLGPGLRVSVQIFLFFVPGIVFLRTTRASEMMRGLSRVLPYRLSFLVFTSLRFVPLFAREIRDIAMAQRARGARLAPRDLLDPRSWKDTFHCLTIPLLVRALRTAEEAARSAEARGFGLRPERTYFDAHLMESADLEDARVEAPPKAPGAPSRARQPATDERPGARSPTRPRTVGRGEARPK